MVDATHKSYDASDRSYFAIIKKELHALASSLEFSDLRIAELDLIIAEITSNLHKYAEGGELLIGHVKTERHEYLEIISLDNGPGISDLSRTLSDGYSSSNTMGHGLGSIKRLSDEFDMYSQKGWGTVLLSRVFKTKPAGNKSLNWFPITVAKPQQQVCGDGFAVKESSRYLKILFTDGLGHGPEANKASNAAIRAFQQCPEHSPAEIIRYMHPLVRKTRGLVATVVVVDRESKKILMSGVGNISTKFIGPLQQKKHLSYNGIIGHNIPGSMNDQVLDLQQYNQVIFCSDGIRSAWDRTKFFGIAKCDPAVQAAAIYKEYRRLTDDTSVLIVKF